MIKLPSKARNELRRAFGQGRLTLYLGAGVSAASGLPTWQRLVLAMYFDMLSNANHRVYSNYLHAVSEWMLQKSPDPLEITAQKIRVHYGSKSDVFLQSLKRQLYAGFYYQNKYQPPARKKLRDANPALASAARLVEKSSIRGSRGLQSVITYNYDSLLEQAINSRNKYHVVHSADSRHGKGIPIYHVHGYVPMADEAGSTSDDIIFTEEQYHQATNEAYSWSNLVQISGFSGSIGLMVGLSLSDRNIRRLLHALSQSPVPASCYAILQRPTWQQPKDHEETEVNEMATKLFDLAKASGSPIPQGYGIKGQDWRYQVRDVLNNVQKVAVEQQEKVLCDLGITPIWYDEHKEVADVLRRLL